MDKKERQKLDREIQKRKHSTHMQQVMLRRKGVEVEAHVKRPHVGADYFNATWKDPETGVAMWGMANLQEVYDYLDSLLEKA